MFQFELELNSSSFLWATDFDKTICKFNTEAYLTLRKTHPRVFETVPLFLNVIYSSTENGVYLFSCLFCFVWTWTFFFKSLASMECCSINAGYNSGKPSECLPVGFIYILRATSSLLVSWSCSTCLSHHISSPLPPSQSSNQLNQTLDFTSCPSGNFTPAPSCLCYLKEG